MTVESVGAGVGSWDLVAAAQGGDRDAFAELYRRYREPVSRFVARRAPGQRELSEDVTSETFLRAWRRIDTVRDRGDGRDVGAWLTTIARNLLTDHYKSGRERYERTFSELPVPRTRDGSAASAERRVLDQVGRENEASAEAQVLDRFDRESAAAAVRGCVASLSSAQREAIERYEQPVKTTATAMGRSEGAVKALRHRAMQAMAERLTARGVSSSWQCAEAVAAAHQAVSRLRPVAQHQPIETHEPADRWADQSVAAEVGMSASGHDELIGDMR